jgi:eukaryotic-like serine/threonine-protein kinase
MTGEMISHYKVLEKLGEGGMGVVYKAHDTKLDRIVALKFLSPQLTSSVNEKRRFVQEAITASALDHPNICTIHEINESTEGQLYIVMPAYEGITLCQRIKKGSLSIDEILNIAVKIAEGLQSAHEKGIYHRDIKSSNIFITHKAQVKIMDFGLAYKSDISQITNTGSTVGTVPYISPEQARGEKIDHRTDIWSLGVILYEMITGQRPFMSDYSQELVYMILREEPEPVINLRSNIPPALVQIVQKALQKNRELRYRTAEEMLLDLTVLQRELQTAHQGIMLRNAPILKRPAVYGVLAVLFLMLSMSIVYFNRVQEERIKSIAVLPFENLSGDPDQEYFADAMTEQITSELARLPGLIVVSRSSVMQYKLNPGRSRDVAKELGVKAIVTGSVWMDGDQLRITVHLIDAQSEVHRWTKDYTRDMSNLLNLQKDVAYAIAGEIRINLSPEKEEYFTETLEIDRRAQQAYLHGIYYLRFYQQGGPSATPEIIQKSIESFEQAIEIEPDWPEAYAKLASAYHWSASSITHGIIDVTDHYEKSKSAAHKAIELDASIADAYGALGFVLHNFYMDWDGAERAYRRAFELEPNNVYRWGYALLLRALGRYEEASTYFPIEQEPLSPVLRVQLALTLGCAGRYDDAFDVLREFAPPGSVRYDWLHAMRELAEQNPDRAVEHLEKYVEHIEKHPVTDEDPALAFISSIAGPAITYAYILAGREDDARTLLPILEEWNMLIPYIYVALGDIEKALLQLERMWNNHNLGLTYIRCMPGAGYADLTEHDGLRDHPKFQDLLRRINFPGE